MDNPDTNEDWDDEAQDALGDLNQSPYLSLLSTGNGSEEPAVDETSSEQAGRDVLVSLYKLLIRPLDLLSVPLLS